MNSKQLVYHLLNGDRETVAHKIPAGFWFHFDPAINKAGIEAQVRAHIDYYEQSGVDVLKIMNENEFRQKHVILEGDDWFQVQPLSIESELYKNAYEINRRIVNVLGGDVFLLGTVHGILASLSHASGHSYSEFPKFLLSEISKHPEEVKKAIYHTYLNVSKMIQVVESSGVDGIYYALLGAERDKLPREVYEEYILPYDRRIAEQCKSKLFLHVCKQNVELERIQAIDFDVINWSIHESAYTIKAVQSLFPGKVILGGFDDRSGCLVDGSLEDIRAKMNDIFENSDTSKLIVGADCTLPTNIDYSKVRYVVNELNSRFCNEL